jgi:hypothetical protein
MAISITSSVNLNDTTNVSSGLAVTITGKTNPAYPVNFSLTINGVEIATATSTSTSLTITGITASEIWTNASGYSFTNAVNLFAYEWSDFVGGTLVSSTNKLGNLTINTRLSNLSVTSPTTASPLDMDLANPVNIISTFTNPQTGAFYGRLKGYVGNSSGGASTSWTQVFSRPQFNTGTNFDVVDVGYDDEIIAAMASVSPKDMKFELITQFKTGASSYTDLSGVSDDFTVSSAVIKAFIQKSTIAFNNFTINANLATNDLPFTLNKFESTATHTVKLYVNSVLIKTVTGITTSGSLDITSTDITNMLLATDQVNSAVAYLTVETFVGATSYGTNNSNNVTATVDSGYVPVISAQSHAENTTTPNVATLIGKYVKLISTIKFLISGNTTSSGTRIKQIKATIGSQVITEDYTYASNTTSITNADLITSALANFGTGITATISITDWRSRTTTYTWSDLVILDYSFPTVLSIDVARADSGGGANPLGVFMNVVLNASVSSLINSTEKNELYYRIGYKVVGAGGYTYYTAVDTNALTFNSTETKGTAVSQEFATTNAYDIVVEVYDVLTSAIKTLAYDILPKGYVPLQIGENYIASGKVHSGVGIIDVGADANKISINLDGGIKFPATANVSTNANVLDDYEEGTFTPEVAGTTTAGVGTYTVQKGEYTRIGNLVKFKIDLEWSAHNGTGNIVINGLPFTSDANGRSAVAIYVSALTLGTNYVAQGYIPENSTQIFPTRYTIGGSAAGVVPMDTAATLFISGEYFV